MTDQEILEWAAKAAGIEWYGFYGDSHHPCQYLDIGEGDVVPWNPLLDSEDAFKLSLDLQISLDFRGCSAQGPGYISAVYSLGRGSRLWETVQYVPEAMFTPNHHGDERFAKYLVEGGAYVRGLEKAACRAITLAASSIAQHNSLK